MDIVLLKIMICLRCKAEIPADAVVVNCYGNCKGIYHIHCSGLSLTTYRKRSDSDKKKWACVDCRKGSNSSIDKNQTEDEEDCAEVVHTKAKLSLDEKMDLILSQLGEKDEKMDLILAQLVEKDEKMNQLLAQQIKANEELQKNNSLLEAYRQEIADLKADLQDRDNRLDELRDEVRVLQQEGKEKFVELQNIPMLEGENEVKLIKLAIDTFRSFGVELADSEVEDCYRIKFKTKATPGPVVVELASKRKVREILAKRKKEVHQSDIVEGQSEEVKVYINESLSKFNRELLFETRKKAAAKGFKYAWVKSGKVFLRKDETSAIIRVNSIMELGTI